MKANEFIKVKSLEEAYKLVKESPRNKIVGGGLWLKKGNASVDKLIDLSLLDLDKIEDKGEYVSIIGTNNCSLILAQLLMYYQAVPIVMGVDESEIAAAKADKCSIVFTVHSFS